MASPIEPLATVEAILGLPRAGVILLSGALLATSNEAEHLLATMGDLTRRMAVSTKQQATRTVGQIRGPILWSETVAARASSLGDEGVFVCQATARAYDTSENRVLAHSLSLLQKAAHDVEHNRATGQLNEVITLIRHVGDRAVRALDHRTLMEVPRGRPTMRDVQRTRAGIRRRSYQPALAVLDRAATPFIAGDIVAVCDDRSRRWLQLLADVLAAADHRRLDLARLRAQSGVIFTGPVSFRHPGHRGLSTQLAGVVVGDVRLVPGGDETDGDGRAPDDTTTRQVVSGPGDIEAALDQLTG
ncbi:MAG TPA: hypothetical protein VGA13_11170 [Acidimicrobiales bacterium]